MGHRPLWNLLIEMKLEDFTLQNLVEDLSSSNTLISEKDVFSSKVLLKKVSSLGEYGLKEKIAKTKGKDRKLALW